MYVPSMLLFAPAVEPAEIFAVPEQGVLRFEYPVVLVREDDESGRDSHHLCRIVGCHSLVCRDAEIHASMCHEQGSVPCGDLFVRRIGIMPYGSRSAAPR